MARTAEQIPHSRDALLALVEKVRAAEGPDREIDYKVFAAFVESGIPAIWDPNEGHRYTSSSDEAVTLAERVLPATKSFAPGSPSSSGWRLTFYRGLTPSTENYGHWEANIRRHARDGHTATGKTLPLAILGALLEALLALTEETAHA